MGGYVITFFCRRFTLLMRGRHIKKYFFCKVSIEKDLRSRAKASGLSVSPPTLPRRCPASPVSADQQVPQGEKKSGAAITTDVNDLTMDVDLRLICSIYIHTFLQRL